MRHSLLPALWAVLAVALSAAALLLLRHAPVQTDLLALLPPTERSQTAERAVAAMSNAAGNRLVFLLGHPDAAKARRAAQRFAAELERSRAFAAVHFEIPDFDPRMVTAPHREFRFGLLTDADRAALARGEVDIEQWLLRRLNDPFRAAWTGGLAQDPLGFFDNFVASLPYRQARLELEEGLLVVREDQAPRAAYVLVSAELPGSAFDDRIQRSAKAAVAAAESAARDADARVEVLRTGTLFFAEAARSSAERDVELIGAGSLVGIVILMLAVFRSVRPLALGLLTVFIGLGAAVSATVLTLGELHLLTLVFGASLIGEAIDYSVQYFSVHAGAGARWDAREGMARVRPGLTLALATSVLGYAALAFMPFPAVRQIALFALAGLIAAYLSVVLLLPVLLKRAYRHDISALAAPAARWVSLWDARMRPSAAAAVALVVVLACAPGWLLLGSDDDVRWLSSRPPGLLAEEARIRALTGVDVASRFFVVEADSAEATLQAEEALTARLQPLVESGALAAYQAVSSFVPSALRQQENRALLGRTLQAQEGKALASAFQHAGLKSAAALELAHAYRESEGRVLTPQAWLRSPLATPFRPLWLGETPRGHASVVVPVGVAAGLDLEGAAAGLPNVMLVDKAASVSRLFGEYRRGLSFGLVVASLVVLAILVWRYGLRGGGAVLLPPLLGIGAALAVSGYRGAPLTLFTMMALLLVLGVGVNYAIFLIEGRARPGTTSIAVLLSAATTVLSFGLLAFSGTPALAGFGATLLCGIAVGVLATPLSLTLFGESRP
jgi:predicted exporter